MSASTEPEAKRSRCVRNLHLLRSAQGPDLRSSKLSLRSLARRQGASSRGCLQIVAHDGASRCAASDHLESRACERRGGTGKDVRCALRCACVDRITFERRRPRALCGLQSRKDKLSHDPLPTIAPSHEETGDRSDGHGAHTREPPHVIKPRERIAGRELAPAHWQFSIEREQARRTTTLDDLP